MTAPSSEPAAGVSSGGSAAPSAVGSSAPTAQSTPGSTAGTLDKTAIAALQVALASENSAVWAYSLVAGYDQDNADTAADMRNAHMVRRDDVAARLSAAGATPKPAAPAYKLPAPVTDKKSARTLAITIESDNAAAWLGVVGSTDDAELRSYALAGLTDAAVRLTRWKRIAKTTPLTTPFPGRPTAD